MKVCSKCNQEKPYSEFPTSKRERGGVSYECKSCRHLYYLKNREKFIQASRDNRVKNREKILVYKKEYAQRNRERIMKYQEEYRHKTRDNRINQYYLYKYGLTPQQREDLFQKQKGKCAICGTGFQTIASAHVDHDHETGKVRGLLCNSCNLLIGFAKENEFVLSAAISYLRIHQPRKEVSENSLALIWSGPSI